MTRTFVTVVLRTWQNRILYRLKRLREMRYLFGAIFAVAYFGFLFSRQGGVGLHETAAALTVDIAAVFILGTAFFAWAVPGISALEFSEAEMHFLFTAPLSRARVLQYKMIRAQPPILIGGLVAAALGVPNGAFVGLWAAYTVLTIYSLFVVLARERLRDKGVPSYVISAAALALTAATAWLLYLTARRPEDGGTPWDSPLADAVLFLPRVFANALFAKDPASLALHIAALVPIGALLFYASTRFHVRFEELAAEWSARAARRRARMTGTSPTAAVTFKRLPPLFRLGPRATPELAIVWKNLIALTRIASPWIVFIFAIHGFLVFESFVVEDEGLLRSIGGLAIGVCAFFPLIGGRVFDQDLRMDITRLDTLKTWPIAGERLVAAELAAPLAALSLVELLLLASTWVILERADFAQVTPQIVTAALLLAIPICAIQLLLRNAVSLFFPGWANRPREEQRGIAAAGPQLLAGIANVIVLALTLAPAAAVAAAGWWLAHRLDADSALLLAAAIMPAVFLLAGEAWIGVKLLGAQYERLDASKDLEPGTA